MSILLVARSDKFSFSASHLAASLDAPLSDKTYTLAPLASGLIQASAWIDTKMLAPTVARVTLG